MLHFENDYSEIAHPLILQRLVETNLDSVSGYGNDPYCDSAKQKIRAACACPEADVYFLVGGTQANATVIATMLRQGEGVIAADTGHIADHEAGAVEYTGHKVLTIPHENGKVMPAALLAYLRSFHSGANNDHMVYPGMLYISHPTEYGSLYTKQELTELSAICREYEIPLFLDGARLGYGLVSDGTDVTLPDIASACDVFYIGGTKVGALCGEAVVFTRGGTPRRFVSLIKQHGALLAKGRVLGVQFDTLFTDDLYTKISENAIETAWVLKAAFKEKGYRTYIDSPSNQMFVVLDNETLERLKKDVVFSVWGPEDENHTIVRFVTAWSTRMEDVQALIALL